MNGTVKALISLTINFLVFIIAYFALRWLEAATMPIKVFLQYLPYAFFIIGIFFGWRFKRGRVFFCSLTLMLGQLALLHYIPHGMDRTEYYDMMLSIVSVYVPLNILVFSVLRERGIVSAWGRARFLFIIIESLIGAWIIWYNDTDLLQLFNIKLFPADIKLLSGFPHISLVLFLTALAYLFTRQAITGKTNDAPFMGITIFTFAALALSKNVYAAAIMFALSGILLAAVAIRVPYSMAHLDELTGLSSRRAQKEEMRFYKEK